MLALGVSLTTAGMKHPRHRRWKPRRRRQADPYRWQFGQLQGRPVFIGGGGFRIDYCELIGKDDKGSMRTGVMVNIAGGANAEAFAKHGALSAPIQSCTKPAARYSRFLPCPAVSNASPQRAARAITGSKSPGRTIQIEGEDDERVGEDPSAASGGGRALIRCLDIGPIRVALPFHE